jgi:hypothetical protein
MQAFLERHLSRLLIILAGFTFLSDSEQTASLYTLVQHAKPAQLKFLSAVLSQMTDASNILPGMG